MDNVTILIERYHKREKITLVIVFQIQKAAAQQQQRQTITSSVTGGVFNKEKVITHSSSNFSSSKGFSTSVSHVSFIFIFVLIRIESTS